MRRDSDWPWYVRCYYADNVKPPKRPGELAIETKHKDEVSRDITIQAAHSREDIGRVDWGPRHVDF